MRSRQSGLRFTRAVLKGGIGDHRRKHDLSRQTWRDRLEHNGPAHRSQRYPAHRPGEEDARALAPRLKDIAFDHVLSSPLQRARRTCELAGFLGVAKLDPDLVEWDYGDYEGRRLAQIHRERPEWELFRDGSPGGESVLQITQRVDRVMSRLRAVEGNILIFFQRACAARARRAVDRRRRITRAQPGAGPNRRMRAGLRARPAG
jgi:broad specificity phosphatase PhoE